MCQANVLQHRFHPVKGTVPCHLSETCPMAFGWQASLHH